MKTDCEKTDILIWARDEALKEAITTILEEEGLKIQTAYDEHEMFKLLDEHQPQIAILESGLPRVFGLEAHEIIRRIERFRDIKIILLYSSACDPDANPDFIYGPDEYIETDRVKDLLISKIREMGVRSCITTMDIHCRNARPDPIHREARKLAKIIVSDIALYNKDKIEKGLMEGNFFELLRNEIEKGRTFYNNRVPPDILAKTNYFDDVFEDFIRLSFFEYNNNRSDNKQKTR